MKHVIYVAEVDADMRRLNPDQLATVARYGRSYAVRAAVRELTRRGRQAPGASRTPPLNEREFRAAYDRQVAHVADDDPAEGR